MTHLDLNRKSLIKIKNLFNKVQPHKETTDQFTKTMRQSIKHLQPDATRVVLLCGGLKIRRIYFCSSSGSSEPEHLHEPP